MNPAEPGHKLRNAWWGVVGGENHNGYNVRMYSGYQFGCNGDERHKGIDIRPKGSGGPGNFIDAGVPGYILAWGDGIIRFNSYDDGGYNRFIGVYFPSIDMSLDIGHLRNGDVRFRDTGDRFEQGEILASIGSKDDGLGARHVHFRAGSGHWGATAITPCKDINPYRVWQALGL